MSPDKMSNKKELIGRNRPEYVLLPISNAKRRFRPNEDAALAEESDVVVSES